MKITTINGREMGTTFKDIPSPALTLLFEGKASDLPDFASEGDRAYGMGGDDKGKVFEYSEAEHDWQKVEDAPTELPDASEATAGDVLTVVDGEWAAAAPSGGGSAAYTLLFDDATLEFYLPEGVTQASLIGLVADGIMPVLIYETIDVITEEVTGRLPFYFAAHYESTNRPRLEFHPFTLTETIAGVPEYVIVYDDDSLYVHFPGGEE